VSQSIFIILFGLSLLFMPFVDMIRKYGLSEDMVEIFLSNAKLEDLFLYRSLIISGIGFFSLGLIYWFVPK